MDDPANARRPGGRLSKPALVLLGALTACSGGQTGDSDGDKDPSPASASAENAGADPSGPSGPSDPATAGGAASEQPGRLSVTVSWLGAPAELRREAGRNRCGADRPAPLAVHTLGGVRGAAVWLEGAADDAAAVSPDRESTTAGETSPAELAVRACQIQPRVTVLAPAQRRLAVRNDDERRHRITVTAAPGPGPGPAPATADDAGSQATPGDLWLPIVGAAAAITLPRAGAWRVASAADPQHPSYVLASEHRTIAITDTRGRATFAQLAPGRYPLVIWHPPVKAGGTPLVVRREIAIDGSETATAVDIELSTAAD